MEKEKYKDIVIQHAKNKNMKLKDCIIQEKRMFLKMIEVAAKNLATLDEMEREIPITQNNITNDTPPKSINYSPENDFSDLSWAMFF